MNFSTSALFAGILFGAVGFTAFVYGKKRSEWKLMVIGGALMVVPYFVQNAWALWITGLVLVAAFWFFRD